MALGTAAGAEQLFALPRLQPALHLLERLQWLQEVERHLAVRAQDAQQPLGDAAQERTGKEMRVHAQGQHALHRPGRQRGVQRGQDEVTAVGGAHRGLGRHRVADFADHDHVRRLAEYAAEQVREIDLQPEVDLRLADARQRILDRILDGVDLALRRVQVRQAGVQRRRLARAGRSRHQDQAAGALQHVEQPVEIVPQQAELIELERLGGPLENAQGQVFAVERGDGVDAQVDDRARVAADHAAAVQGPAALGHVHAGDGLDVRQAALAVLDGHFRQNAQHPQVAHADGDGTLVGAEVDVAGLHLDGLVHHMVDDVLRRQAAHVELQGFVGGRGVGVHVFSPANWARAAASSSAMPNSRSIRQN